MNTSKAHIKTIVWDILTDISWGKISQKYFGKSATWIYQRMDVTDANEKATEFTEIEKETLKNALYDLSERIRKCADEI